MDCTRVKLANVRRGAILKTARNIMFFLGVIFIFLFGFPIVGILSALQLSSWLGCEFSARGASACMLWGWDIGERLYVYVMPMIGSLLTPIALVMGFWDVLLAWAVLVVLLHVLWRRNAKKANSTL